MRYQRKILQELPFNYLWLFTVLYIIIYICTTEFENAKLAKNYTKSKYLDNLFLKDNFFILLMREILICQRVKSFKYAKKTKQCLDSKLWEVFKSDNLQYNTLVCWDKQLVNQASDVPSIILFFSWFLAKFVAKIISFTKKIKSFECPTQQMFTGVYRVFIRAN